METHKCAACHRYTVAVRGDVCGLCDMKAAKSLKEGLWERTRWYVQGMLAGIVFVGIVWMVWMMVR